MGLCNASPTSRAQKLRHRSEVCGEDFTVAGLQCCNEEIHGLFRSCVDFF